MLDDDSEEDMGMAEALMMRGSHLRHLRELAEADEKERQEEAEKAPNDGDVIDHLSNGHRVLRYSSYLAHQRYYDDLKHVDCNYIDYGDGCIIQQEKSLGKGGLCWDAAFILAEHLLNENMLTANDTIVELGAGTGLCGLLLSKNTPCHVEITDLPALMHLMQRNVDLNRVPAGVENMAEDDQQVLFGECSTPPKGTCEARVLEWGPQPPSQKKYSVILGADVVASLYDPIALADTIHQLCNDEVATVWISYKGRLDGPHLAFEARMKELFESVEPRIQPVSRNKNPQVYLLRATVGLRDN